MDLSPGLQAAASRRRWLFYVNSGPPAKPAHPRIVFQAGFGGTRKSGMLLKSDLSVHCDEF
jgi:hypothetical protein